MSLQEARIGKAIGGHHSAKAKTDNWLTPPEIIVALGEFDLDPCASTNRPWGTAKNHYTEEDNGLLRVWEGRVWLNPPYGAEAAQWLDRLALHGNGIALVFARTETGSEREGGRKVKRCPTHGTKHTGQCPKCAEKAAFRREQNRKSKEGRKS